MEKILITGSNGYLGTCIYHDLKKVYSVDHLIVRLEDIKPKSLDYDLVIHCAGALRYRKGQHQHSNEEGTKKLIIGLKKKSKLVYISSKSIYGTTLTGEVSEKTTPKPDDDYGISKYRGELAVVESGLPYIIIRASTLMGLGIKNVGPSFPSLSLKNLILGKNIDLYYPDVFHEYLYVKDLSLIILKLIKINKWNKTFNVSGNKESLHSLFNTIESFLISNNCLNGQINYVEKKCRPHFFMDSSQLISYLGGPFYTSNKIVIKELGDYIISEICNKKVDL